MRRYYFLGESLRNNVTQLETNLVNSHKILFNRVNKLIFIG